MDEALKPSVEPIKKPKKSKQSWIWVLLVVLAVAGAAYAGYWYRGQAADKEQKKQQAANVLLQVQVTSLQKDLATEKAKNVASATAKTTTSVTPSAATLQSIKDSITSGNTAALEGYMASSVNVIIAASDGLGARTPTQAVSDITSYIKSATSPWDFALPAATLTTYRNGTYGQYFPTTAVVGKSANGMVISFTFDSTGKISGVFMAANSNLL